MSDNDIQDYYSDEQHFAGVFANNNLPIPQKNKAYIINLQNSNEGGSHWVALFNGNYFDSYGEVPTKNVSQYVKHYNHDDFQGLNAESCGYFAMYAVYNFLKHRSPSYGLIPNKTTHNENVLKQFFF